MELEGGDGGRVEQQWDERMLRFFIFDATFFFIFYYILFRLETLTEILKLVLVPTIQN